MKRTCDVLPVAMFIKSAIFIWIQFSYVQQKAKMTIISDWKMGGFLIKIDVKGNKETYCTRIERYFPHQNWDIVALSY